MIKVTQKGVILNKTDAGFENAGVLNPAIVQEGNRIQICGLCGLIGLGKPRERDCPLTLRAFFSRTRL